jgi:putative peptidoglycan lipid II flippase
MILGMTATQINTLADDFIALWLADEGAVSQLYYSQRLYQFPLGVLGISLATAIFPVMSADAAKKDMAALAATISRGLRSAVFIALPATAGLIIVRHILISVLFERGEFTALDTQMTAPVLSFYALGLCGFFLQQIVTRCFYSLQQSKLPARTACLAVVVNIILNLTLIWFMGVPGLALSTAICSYLQVTLLMKGLRRTIDQPLYKGMTTTLIKSVIATALMTAAALLILRLMGGLGQTKAFDLLRLLVVVPVAAIVYTAAALVLRSEMLSLVIGRRTSRIHRQ